MVESIDPMIKQLATLQARHRKLQKQLDDSRMAWFAANQQTITEAEQVKRQIDELTEAIRQLATAMYGETGEKKPHPSVTVYKRKVLEYDPDMVTEWLLEMGFDHLLTVSRGKFAEFARKTPLPIPSEVARFEEKTSVRIAPLGEYVSEDSEE